MNARTADACDPSSHLAFIVLAARIYIDNVAVWRELKKFQVVLFGMEVTFVGGAATVYAFAREVAFLKLCRELFYL